MTEPEEPEVPAGVAYAQPATASASVASETEEPGGSSGDDEES